jgi:hypothetical protein
MRAAGRAAHPPAHCVRLTLRRAGGAKPFSVVVPKGSVPIPPSPPPTMRLAAGSAGMRPPPVPPSFRAALFCGFLVCLFSSALGEGVSVRRCWAVLRVIIGPFAPASFRPCPLGPCPLGHRGYRRPGFPGCKTPRRVCMAAQLRSGLPPRSHVHRRRVCYRGSWTRALPSPRREPEIRERMSQVIPDARRARANWRGSGATTAGVSLAPMPGYSTPNLVPSDTGGEVRGVSA